MPSTSSLTSTGALQYIIKTPFSSPTPTLPANNNPFQNLFACGIVTDVQGKSFNVVLNGIIIGHFEVDEIVSWELSQNIINVKTKDQVPYALFFYSVTEAINADGRINNNMNGIITTGC